MTSMEYQKKLADFVNRLQTENEKGSTGSFGKLADEMYRRALLEKGVNADCAVGCRKWSQDDALTKRFGAVEIKTGSGAVAYTFDGIFSNDDRLNESLILADKDTIVWVPFGQKGLTPDNMWDLAWIFTREQFIAMLKYAGKKGLASSLKLAKEGHQINIQTIGGKFRERIIEILIQTPTVRDLVPASKLAKLTEMFREAIGGV